MHVDGWSNQFGAFGKLQNVILYVKLNFLGSFQEVLVELTWYNR